MNKWIGLGLAAAALGIVGCVGGLDLPGSAKVVKGTGNARTESFSLDKFQSIRVGGAMKVVVLVGGEQDVKVVGDEALFDLLTIKVVGGELRIETEGVVESDVETVVTISMADLNKLDLSGAVTLDAEGVDTDALTLDMSGASTVTLQGNVDALTVDASGATKGLLTALATNDVELDGSGAVKFEFGDVPGILDIGLSGAGSVLAGEEGDLTVDVSGAAKVSARATGDVRIDASGACKISVGPDANIVHESVSGVASVSRK